MFFGTIIKKVHIMAVKFYIAIRNMEVVVAV